MSLIAAPDDLVDRIHEAGLVPSLWIAMLDELSSRIGSNGGYLFGVRDSYVSGVSTADHAETMHQFMNDGWAARDLALKRAAALNHAGFVSDQDLLTDEEILTDDVYANFYRPRGIGYRVGTIVPVSNGDSIAIVMPRHQDKGPVPREVVVYLDGLRPHLARASLTANRLGFERARAQADAMQALGLPGAVLRGSGRISAANALFEALMPSLFQDRRERMIVTDFAADALLANAIATLSVTGARSVKSIPIVASDERGPMVLHLVPVRGAAHDVFMQATALLVVTPVDRAAVPTAEVLQGLFDLTPAEARVARAIGQTQTIEDIAVERGVSRETVRIQLKTVLGKTGMNRQSELVSLLAGVTVGR